LKLVDLHARIRACTKCVAAGYLERARPIVAGSIRDRIAIVGQAPGAVALTPGQPFSGRSGAELRRWLAEAGIDEDHLPYRTAITKCFPGKSPTGSGDRRPSPAELALCRPWLHDELALLRPRVILLLGGLAIDRFSGTALPHRYPSPLQKSPCYRADITARAPFPFSEQDEVGFRARCASERSREPSAKHGSRGGSPIDHGRCLGDGHAFAHKPVSLGDRI